jgi:hypothetical protein
MEKGYYKYFKYVAPRLLRIIKALDKMEHYNTDTLYKFINQYSLLVHRKLDILHEFIQLLKDINDRVKLKKNSPN